jgi:hypothetical protein
MTDVGVLVAIDDESIKPRPELDYTSRDFTAIRAQLIGLAKGIMPEWTTSGESADFGTLLIELFAYMGDTLNFYIDRTASEAFLSTAVRPQSVMYIADMLGYIPIGQHAASVTLTFNMDESLDPDHPLPDVTLPRGTRVHNTGDGAATLIVFEIQEEFTIKPGGEVSIFATEGITVRDALIGTVHGAPNADFIIQDTGVIYGTVEVITIEGYQTVVWSHVTDISLARPNQTAFTTYQDDQNRTHVVFGDNAAGRIPSVNSQVYVNYRFGVGAIANELTAGSLKTIIPPPTVDITTISVTNDKAPIGGSDPESIASIRYSVPRSGARIRNRAVTLNDYADLAMQVPGVAKSVSYGTVYTSVRVRIAPVGMDQDDAAMERLTKAVDQYLTDKILIGSSVYIEPPTSDALWQMLYIRMVIHVAETYNRSSVREQVDSVIRKILDYDIVDFGTRVTMGSIYRAVLSVAGVDWADLRWLSVDPPPDIDPSTPAGGGGASQPLFTGTWQYNTSTSTGDPGTRKQSLNDPTTITRITFSKNDITDTLKGVNLLALKVGDHIVMRPQSNTTSWRSFIVTAAPVNNAGSPGWVDITVVLNQAADTLITPNANDPILFDFLRFTPSPVSAGDVADIDVDDLKIPRIETTEYVEEDTDEVQVLTATGPPTGGQWKLTTITNKHGTIQTADIAYNAKAADIKAALNTAIPGNTITVATTGTDAAADTINTKPMRLTFEDYGNVSTSTIQAGTTPLSGAGAGIGVTITTEGASSIYVEAGLTEDERTHDGLWVIARGGLANT